MLDCDPQILAPGQVRARFVACNDEAPATGEGRKGDVLLQSASLSVVLRNPWESLTRPGHGGGTLIDATTPGWRDRVLELFPLVQDGFFDAEDATLGVDADGAWATLTGTGVSFEPLGEGTTGAVSLTWSVDPDRPILRLEGADGLWLRPAQGATWVDAGYILDGHALLTDGTRVSDSGGALWLDDVHTLTIAPIDEAVALRWPEGEPADGHCEGDGVELWAGDRLVALLGPDFDTLVPDDALLVCVAAAHTPGAPTLAGTGLALAPGARGGLAVRAVDDQGRDLAVAVTWEDGLAALPPGGGEAPIPPGTWTLSLDAGPAHDRWSGTVTVPGEPVGPTLRRAIDTERHVLVELGRAPWPGWDSGATPAEDLALAASLGRDLVVHTPLDEVGQPESQGWAARHVRGLAGSRLETPDQGRIWSWSWTPTDKRAGHGAVAWQDRSAPDLLALAAGGTGDRFTAVDAAWVAAAGEPWSWRPVPDLLRLDSLADLPVLLDLLAQGVPIGVVGPLAWGTADTATLPGASALQRDLVTGAACATTGPLLILADETPAWQPVDQTLTLSLQARPSADVTALVLYVDGVPVASVRVAPEASAHTLRWSGPVQRSAVGVAEGADWAVSAPILRLP